MSSAAETEPVDDIAPTHTAGGHARGRTARRILQLISAGVLVVAILVLLWLEQLAAAPAAAALFGLAVFIWASGWWKNRRALAVAATLDLILILAYSWSLGDSIHLVVQTTKTGYVADLGGNLGYLDLPSHQSGQVGLYLPARSDNAISAAGQAGMPAGNTPLTWLGKLMRFVTPGAGWANLKLVEYRRDGPVVSFPTQLARIPSRWNRNARGDFVGPLGKVAFLPVTPKGTFVFSVDLMRPDGLQGVLVGVKHHHGYLFGVRMDVRQAWWHTWNKRRGVGKWNGQGTRVFDLVDTEMIKRLLRLAVPSVILGLLILLCALPVYALSALFIDLVRRTRGPFVLGGARMQPDWAAASAVVAGAAVVATAGIMGWISAVVYRGIPNVQDAVAYFFQAKTLTTGRLWAPAPQLPSFFSQQFILVYHGHWFGKYPPGWPLVLAIGLLVHAPWLVGPVMSAASLGLLYLIGREIYGWKVGILAALLGLTSPFWLFLGASYYPHAASGFFLISFVYLLVLWDRKVSGERTRVWSWRATDALFLIPAGLVFGLAFITRQLDAAVLSVPFLVIFLRRPLALVWVGFGAVWPAIFYLFYNRLVTGSFFGNAYTLERPFDRLGFGRHVGGPTAYSANFTFARGLWNVSYDLAHLESGLFGWPYFFAIALVAVPFALGRARRWDWIFAASVLCLVSAYIFYFADGVWFTYPRYWYVTIPWLCLLVARGFQELYRWPLWVGLRLPRIRGAALIAPGLLLGVLVLYDAIIYTPATTALISSYGRHSLIAITAAKRARLHNALIFQVQNKTLWWPYGGVLPQNSPLLTGNIIWARDEGPKDVQLMALYPTRRFYRMTNSRITEIYPPPGL